MDLQQFWDLLYQNIIDTSILEVIAVIFGLLSVWYSKKVNILVYPTGIISVVIYVYICLGAKLYADMGINFVYFVMSIYGWYMWTRKDQNRKVRPISMCTKKEHLINIGMFVFFFLGLSYILTNFTDSNVPIWDSLTTAIFIVGMWLMAMKKVENWLLWIVGDIISIPLYFYKGLVLTSLQFTIFLVIAIAGYYAWKAKLETENA
ncbi:MAG: nicotinamide mononucleotide transporter [Bacteroidetes bacterium]|nr:nicotinamide mononucleotide transporter [Bacteroidota bacterium]